MTKKNITHGIIDHKGVFRAAPTPSPTAANNGHVDSSIATAQAHALFSGKPTTLATATNDGKGNVTVRPLGKVKAAMRGAKTAAGSGNTMGRIGSNNQA